MRLLSGCNIRTESSSLSVWPSVGNRAFPVIANAAVRHSLTGRASPGCNLSFDSTGYVACAAAVVILLSTPSFYLTVGSRTFSVVVKLGCNANIESHFAFYCTYR